MDKKIANFTSLFCMIFAISANSENGKMVMEKSTEFMKCLVQKSDKSSQEKNQFLENFSDSERATLQINAMVEKMDQNCSTEELTRVAEKVDCYVRTCNESTAGFK